MHSETPQNEWDALVGQIDESTYLHSWNWIRYTSLFRNDGVQGSFILLDNQSNPVAICPLGLSIDPSSQVKELSLGGNPIAIPAIINIKPRLRRKIQNGVFDEVRKFAKLHGAQRAHFLSHPLTQGFCKNTLYAGVNSFGSQKYQLLPDVDNTCIMDLSLSPETLMENLNPYQRKHYRKSQKQGITVQAFSKNENAHELKKFLEAQRQAHYVSAGRWTRPASTWEAMGDQALDGRATLFVSFLNNEKPMSFLFCGEFSSMAFGWSQVNFDEYEREYSLRHFLEWEAICHYQKRGFRFYEVGERHYGPTWLSQHSPKEINISEFKERFGGFMLPKIHWTGFLDQSLMKKTLEESVLHLSSQRLDFGSSQDEEVEN